MNAPTTAQHAAITLGGNVVVMAGAGAGKTGTLVERCLARVLDPEDRIGLEEILVVTFTEAAALQMRERIRRRLEIELGRCRNESVPETPARMRHIEEQLALVESAHISTLHGFCLRLIRSHSLELGIDPQAQVLDADTAHLLREEVWREMLDHWYAGAGPDSEAVLAWIQTEGGGRDGLLRDLIFRLHDHTQTRPDPGAWLDVQRRQFESADPAPWIAMLLDGVRAWRDYWLPVLEDQPPENTTAHRIIATLSAPGAVADRATAAVTLGAVIEADLVWPTRRKTVLRKPIEKLFAQAEFLRSLASATGRTDPLAEDWNWVRPSMLTVLGVADRFGEEYAKAKQDQGFLDFHDLEQFTLRLLWEPGRTQPSAVALRWREQFHHVLVDEYQDINAAQDAIIRALGRDGPGANRFLVGDVKQSIYRFRQAEPGIFQGYARLWGAGDGGRMITLADNFRSREALLNFINPLFSRLMCESVGGVGYGSEAALSFGGRESRGELSTTVRPEPRVEVDLLLRSVAPADDDGAADSVGEPAGSEPMMAGSAEREAGWIARRLRELHETGHEIWDDVAAKFRPVNWGDMVILLRAPSGKADHYARAFSRAGVPLTVERPGFYESTEVVDLLSLLQLLDNPLQDIPVLAVLRSPLVGLTLDELASIRLAVRGVPFWTALTRWQEGSAETTGPAPATEEARKRVGDFLQRFERWRRMGRSTSLSQRLEAIIDETHYVEWLSTHDRSRERLGNLRQLVSLARDFDPFQRHGLARFLRYVAAQEEAGLDREPSAPEAVDAVKLVSIHASKGLEYPVVVLADLGKKFNEQEYRENVVLDLELGLCPRVKPPGTGARYPSLPYFLSQQHQRRAALGEEMRLLYVALTRARDTLILVGTVDEKVATTAWPKAAERPSPTDHEILTGRSFLDWLGPWLAGRAGLGWLGSEEGSSELFRWHRIGAGELAREPVPEHQGESGSVGKTLDPGDLAAVAARLSWRYPHGATRAEPAKQSVSVLRRRMVGDWAPEGEAKPVFARGRFGRAADEPPGMSAAERGTANHLFLKELDLGRVNSETELQREADRLFQAGVLSAEQTSALDLGAVHAFWNSELGRMILTQREFVRRELPFTARLALTELTAMPGAQVGVEDDWVVVQGVVDLAVIRPEEIWLLDFKTDRIRGGTMAEKVKEYEPQVRLYARALERIHRRPIRRAWLHFLEPGRTQDVPIAGSIPFPSFAADAPVANR